MDYSGFIAQTMREMEEPTGGVISEDSLLEWTNDAFKDFALKTRCLADEQYALTIPGQASYDLPDLTLDTVAVTCGGRTLKRAPSAAFFSMSAQDSASGTPAYYTVYEDALHLYPPPAEETSVRFWRTYRPDPVVSVTATADMPFSGRYNDALRFYVKARAFEQIGDDRANYFDGLYQREVAETSFELGRRDSSDSDNAPVEVY